jgi:hypothetical protein
MTFISAQHGKHANHPGHNVSCELRTQVNAHFQGTSSNGYGCDMTGGHCVPSEHCDNRRNEARQQDAMRADTDSFGQMLAMAMMNGGMAPEKTFFDSKTKKDVVQKQRRPGQNQRHQQ